MTPRTDAVDPVPEAAREAIACLSLREQKKQRTRYALHRAAVELVAEHGLAAVTTGMIADAAGVSPRTFFNYWESKEASILGLVGEREESAGRLIRDRPAGESPKESLRAVLIELGSRVPDDPRLRDDKRRVMHNEPELHRMSGHMMGKLQSVLTDALAERIELARATAPDAQEGDTAIDAASALSPHEEAVIQVHLGFAASRAAFALAIDRGTSLVAELARIYSLLDSGDVAL